MLHFHPLTVKEVRQETADTVSVAFQIPDALKESFSYKPGQYLTIKAIINGEEQRRSYSLCSSPLDNEWRVAVKKVPNGIFSTYANEQLKTGDVLEVMPPLGHFTTEVNDANKKEYIGFAAGSGITPIISIIKTVLHTEPQSRFTLVYGNKNRHSIIFKEIIEGLKNKYIDRFRVIHVLSREVTDANINSGRIDANKCNELFTMFANINADEFFICGPESMIFCVKNFLEAKGVDSKKIHFELFTSPGQKKQTNVSNTQIQDDAPKSKVTIKLDGRSFDFELAYEGENVLDAALRQGADLPYSCKGGVCCSCRAKLVEGEVDMDVNYALEADEVKAGFILTCQAHPKTPSVVIDYDIK